MRIEEHNLSEDILDVLTEELELLTKCASKRGVELLPIEVDALDGPEHIRDLAIVYIQVGEFDAAIDQMEILLHYPSRYSTKIIDVIPELAPLRNHPRLRELKATYPSTDGI